MSHTTIYTIATNGDVRQYGVLQNSWGSAPRIWCPFYLRHFPGATNDSGWLVRGIQQQFWDLAGDESIQAWVRRVFALTFDHTMVAVADFRSLADDLERFEREYTMDGSVSHLEVLAMTLREDSFGTDTIGMCFQWNSISADQWEVRSEGDDDGEQFNIHKHAPKAQWLHDVVKA